jgi:enoyl-CoA hydratase/carnithine racemase
MSGLLEQAQDGHVLRLTLSDDATRNALSLAMLQEMDEALALASATYDISVIVFAARGRAFSSGHNLKELTAHRSDSDRGLAFFETLFSTCARVMTAVSQHRCAVIAEVDGAATAAGCQLVAACDLAYASPNSTFCTPGVNIGLFCSTPMVPLTRTTGSKHAMEMLLTGSVQDAAFAERTGLINKVVPQNELRGHVDGVAQLIASKSANAIQHGKDLFHLQRALPLDEAYEIASAVMAKNMLEASACEGIEAFLQKRAPHWPS